MEKGKRKLKDFIWLLFWTLTLAFIVLGILQVFKVELIAYIFGGIFVVIALSKIAPFIIIKNKLIKWINFIAIILNVFVGVMAIIFASDFDSGSFVTVVIGLMFFLDGAIHFFGLSQPESSNVKDGSYLIFLINLIILTFGAYILFTRDMDVDKLRFVVLGVLTISSLILFYFGYKSFINYYLLVNNMTMDEFKQRRKYAKLAKKKKTKMDEIENELLSIDPTLSSSEDLDEKEKDEEQEEELEDAKEVILDDDETTKEKLEEKENDSLDTLDEDEEHQETKNYMEDQFVKLDDLIKEKKGKN